MVKCLLLQDIESISQIYVPLDVPDLSIPDFCVPGSERLCQFKYMFLRSWSDSFTSEVQIPILIHFLINLYITSGIVFIFQFESRHYS